MIIGGQVPTWREYLAAAAIIAAAFAALGLLTAGVFLLVASLQS